MAELAKEESRGTGVKRDWDFNTKMVTFKPYTPIMGGIIKVTKDIDVPYVGGKPNWNWIQLKVQRTDY